MFQRQRLDGEDLLARQVEPLAAGDDEGRVGGPVEPAAEGGRGVLQDLLEVVEDDQATAAAGNRVAELHAGVVLAEGDVERRGDGEEDPVERTCLGQIAEVDAARPVAEPGPAVAAHEAGLAGAARAEDGEQPGRRRRAAPRARAAPRSGRRRRRARRGGCGGPRGRGARGRPRGPRGKPCRHPPGGEGSGAAHAQLEDLDRLLDPFEPVVAVALDLCCPRAALSPSAVRAAALRSVCPPPASAMTRAASGLARPSTSIRLAPRAMSSAVFSRRVTGPTCSPARALSARSASAWW